MPASGSPNPPTPDRYSCVVYRTRNVGDMIQTLALSRLLPSMTGVFRHDLGAAPADRLFVVNGFLETDAPPRVGATCLFAGVSGPYARRTRYLAWMRRSPWPVGARDPVTATRLSAMGLASELVGCATLTLPRHRGPRSGVLSVDCDGPGERVAHRIPRTMTVARQWELASALLARYRQAEAVYTSRLHVALPCLAFGTPVWIARPPATGLPERFSLLEEMEVPFETLVVRDVAPQAGRYCRFLERHLGIAIDPGEAKLPAPMGPDRIALPARTRFLLEDAHHALRGCWRPAENLVPAVAAEDGGRRR